MTISCILNMYLSLVLEVKMAEISWLADLSHAWESWAFRSRVQWWQGDTWYWWAGLLFERTRKNWADIWRVWQPPALLVAVLPCEQRIIIITIKNTFLDVSFLMSHIYYPPPICLWHKHRIVVPYFRWY